MANKTEKIEMRIAPELKELIEIMVDHSPQSNISELIRSLVLHEACRISTFDNEIKSTLDGILPLKHQKEIIEETCKEWRIYETCQK